ALAGEAGQLAGEAREVHGLHAQGVLRGVELDTGGGGVGDQRGGQRPVVRGADQVPVGAVGHQAADPAEVPRGGVAAGDDDLDVAGELLDLLQDVGGEQHGAALGPHAAQQVHQVHALAGVHAVER